MGVELEHDQVTLNKKNCEFELIYLIGVIFVT